MMVSLILLSGCNTNDVSPEAEVPTVEANVEATEAPPASAQATEPVEETETEPVPTEVTSEPVQEDVDDTVIIGMSEKIEFLNVLYTQGGNSLSGSKLSQRGLLFVDENSEWIGELAIEVPSIENGGVSPDGKVITYKLKEGITWHDGQPVTSADVKATWDMIMDENNAVITRFGYNMIEKIETPDEYTVIITFEAPFMSWPILFDAIVPEHIIEANKDNLDKSEAMRTPIGFGPYLTQFVYYSTPLIFENRFELLGKQIVVFQQFFPQFDN